MIAGLNSPPLTRKKTQAMTVSEIPKPKAMSVERRLQSTHLGSDDLGSPLTQDCEVNESGQLTSVWVRLCRGRTVARVQNLRGRASLPGSGDTSDGRARKVGDAAVRNVRSCFHTLECSKYAYILGSAEGEEQEKRRPDKLWHTDSVNGHRSNSFPH